MTDESGIAESRRVQRRTELGPTGRALAANVERLRKAKALSQTALVAALCAVGRPMPPIAVHRIERGLRRVDADDLIALAVVLGVNPSALLLPPTERPEETIEITGVGEVSARAAWDWADGGRCLGEVSDDDPGRARLLFALHARPPYRRNW